MGTYDEMDARAEGSDTVEWCDDDEEIEPCDEFGFERPYRPEHSTRNVESHRAFMLALRAAGTCQEVA